MDVPGPYLIIGQLVLNTYKSCKVLCLHTTKVRRARSFSYLCWQTGLGSLWLFFQSNFSGFKAVYIEEHYRKVSSHCTAPSLSVRLPPQVWLDFQHREELSVITSTQTKMIEKTWSIPTSRKTQAVNKKECYWLNGTVFIHDYHRLQIYEHSTGEKPL